jgi:hypothetical protein
MDGFGFSIDHSGKCNPFLLRHILYTKHLQITSVINFKIIRVSLRDPKQGKSDDEGGINDLDLRDTSIRLSRLADIDTQRSY